LRRLGRIFAVGVENSEARRDTCIEDPDLLSVDQIEELLRFGLGHDELNLNGEASGELKEMRLVEHMMASKSRHRFECRSTANTQLVRLLEQPFPKQLVVMSVAFVHIKTQKVAFAHLLSPFQQRLVSPILYPIPRSTARMVNIPTPVAAKDPSMCAPIAAKAQPNCASPKRLTTSDENVENVVSPPRNPGADKDAQERKRSHTEPLKEDRCGG
jgi:hypothetical protein